MCPFVAAYMGFMWMLLLVAYGQRDPNAFFLNRHIRGSFGGGISHSMSLGDVFTWAKTTLLSNLFNKDYPGKNDPSCRGERSDQALFVLILATRAAKKCLWF